MRTRRERGEGGEKEEEEDERRWKDGARKNRRSKGVN